MDKGIKGLLSGDISVYILKQIESSLDKYKPDLDMYSQQIQELLEKQQSLETFYSENFSTNMSMDKAPNYDYYQNFENYLLLLQKNDWKKHVQIKPSTNY